MGGSGRGGGSNNNGGAAVANQTIPASSKKMIQSLKEIVKDCPEAEIYLMLKDCNMDPNEAVNRLLSQDPFHEVKSKREKKKETKDVTDTRSRGSGSNSTRGGRGGVDRYSSRNSASQFASSDYAAHRGKSAYKNGPTGYSNTTVGATGNNVNRRQPVASDAPTENTISINASESILAAPQPSGYQSAWSNMGGQVSMADIVKMGRPHGKTPSGLNTSQQHVNNQHVFSSTAPSVPHDSRPSRDYASQVSVVNQESGLAGKQHVPPNDEWPLDDEPPAVSVSSIVEPSVESYGEPYDRTKQQYRSQADDVRFEEESTVENEHATFVGSVSGSNQNIHENVSASASGFDNELYQNIGSYQGHIHEAEDPDVPVSSVTNEFQSLSLPNDDEEAPSEEDGPAVKIPDHLQVHTADFSHLSFGSFGSGMNAPFPGSFTSGAVPSNEDEPAAASDAPSVGHSEARIPEYYEDDHLRATSDGNNAHRMGAGSANFEAPSVSQADMLKQEAPEVAQANQYSFPSSTTNYTFENSQQLNSSFGNSVPSSQMQGLPSLAGVMPYSNSLPSALLASTMQPLREADLGFQFPISQSMATKYANSVSSISGPNASMAEVLKASNFSAPQPTHTPPGGGISGATALPQHMAVHPYSQHNVPLGPLNMMGFPLVHQSGYAYIPPSFQQTFAAGNSTYPQSLAAAVLPQYKSSVSVSSLPQSSAVSGYGAFGNSSSVPSNFPMNPPSAPAGTSMNYDDVLSSQYKDASHLLSLQHQQGPGSRTMSGVPGSTYYSFQGQNQQPAGFRQSQQPSQHYGPLSGYPNYYHSQAGLSLEHQQQMSRDGSLGGSQGQQPKQTQQQLWQNSY